MKRYWDKVGKVGRTDSYSVTVSEDWLDGQDLATSTVTSGDTAIASPGAETISGNVIHIPITMVAAGSVVFDIIYGTATRSDCVKVELEVEEC